MVSMTRSCRPSKNQPSLSWSMSRAAALKNGFCTGTKPGGGGAVLVASSDVAVHCGNLLKQFGRGGGTAALAQGSVAEPGPLAEALGF